MGFFDFFSSKPQPAGPAPRAPLFDQDITYLDSRNFTSFVTQSDKPVLVEFWADWCGPCKQLAPILSNIASEYSEKVKIAKLDVDDFGDVAAELNVMSIPTMILFRNGREVHRIVGAMPKENILREFSLGALPQPTSQQVTRSSTFPFATLLSRNPVPGSTPGTQQWMEMLYRVVPYQSLTKAIFYFNKGYFTGARMLLTTALGHNYNNPDLQSAIISLLKKAEGAADRPGADTIDALQAGNRDQMPYSAVLWAVENGHTDNEVITAIRALIALQGV